MDQIQNLEIRDKYRGALRSLHRKACWIGLGFIASVFIYVLLVELLNRSIISMPMTAADGPNVAKFKYALLGMAFLTIFLIRPIKRAALAGSFTPKTLVAAQSGSVAGPMQRLLPATLISYAFCESIALYGVVIYVINRNINDFYIFVVIALFLFTRHFPRYREWDNWLSGLSASADS